MNKLTLPTSVRFQTALGDTIVLDGLIGGRGPEASAFLVAGGPSLRNVDLSQLQRRGVFSLAINNAWALFRPSAWIFSDSPGSFVEQGWFDPGIMKFAPVQQNEGRICRSINGEIRELDWRAWHMPNTWFYPRNANFNHETFLSEPTINWGQEEDSPDSLGLKGGRTTMLAALRLLILLGFNRINLLGVDFRMSDGSNNYAFEQARTAAAVRGNNQSYELQIKRLEALRPKFEAVGVEVYNCNPDSHLKVFPFRSYEEALDVASSDCGTPIETAGRYDRNVKPVSRAGRRAHELKKYRYLARNNPSYGASCHGRDAIDLIMKWQPKRVLDCGCGRNGFKDLMKPHGVEVVGVDNAFPEADVSAPIYALPFQDGSFDTVTAFDVLEHVLPEDVDVSLAEMARVAKGGKFCLSIAYTPSKTLVGGENLHPTVRNETWWLRRLRPFVRTLDKAGRYIHGSFK